MTSTQQALVAVLAIALAAGSALGQSPSVEYRTEPRHGHVIFIQNRDALGAREAARAAGIPEQSPASAAGTAAVSATDPEQAQLDEFLRGLNGDDDQNGAATTAPASRPAGKDIWEEIHARGLKDNAPAIQIADQFLAIHGQALGRVKPLIPHTDAPAAWQATVTRGLAHGPHSALIARSAEKDRLGMTHVRYEQRYKDVPVFGAEVIVHVNALGQTTVCNGHLAADLPDMDVTPLISSQAAAEIAKGLWAGEHPPNVLPEVKRTSLYVLQTGLLDNTADGAAFLVWEIELINQAQWVDESFFIGSATGDVRLWLDHVKRINRRVQDCTAAPGTDVCYSNLLVSYNQSPPWQPPPEQYTFGCREGLCPHGPNPRYVPAISLNTDDLYSLLADVHSYYQTRFGIAGTNGQGGNTNGAKVPLDVDAGWTYLNWLSTYDDNCTGAAYWADSGIGFCKDVVAIDAVGHEYTHGTSQVLTYSGESGSLSESLSDVMGEMFEYWKTGANDWLAAAQSFGGPWRSLSDPPSLIDVPAGGSEPFPDRYTSSNVYCGSADNGGVHHNSTIPSKALYLAAVGGTFNGCAISGMGRENAEQILYRAMAQYYTSSETFNGAYLDQIHACMDLYPATDCRGLMHALQAVEMDQVGRCADPSGELAKPNAAIPGDLDRDGDADPDDFLVFAQCATGPGVPYTGGHIPAGCPLTLEPVGLLKPDMDGDGDIDQDDFGMWQRCYSGEGNAPDAACTGNP